MNSKTSQKNIVYVSVLVAGLAVLLCSGSVIAESNLRIYLQKEKTLSTDVIKLGQIAMLLGDQSLTTRANAVTLGQFSLPGQAIKIDRDTILSRLSSEGIKASVTFNGAEKSCLHRAGNCIEADRFVAAAESCLKKALKDENLYALELVRLPENYLLKDDAAGVSLSAHVPGHQTGKTRRVTVSVMRDGVQLHREDVSFSVQYQCYHLVAARDLSPGEEITSGNVKLEPYVSDVPIENSSQFYGNVTRRAVPAGTVITMTMVEPPKPVVIIKRRQKVLLKLEAGGLYVSAIGEAMSDGGVGDLIEIRRGKGREQRTIIGKVMADGSIEPMI